MRLTRHADHRPFSSRSPGDVGRSGGGTGDERDASPVPPVADKRAHEVIAPAGTRTDEYYWLRDDARESPEVLAYLRAENAYTTSVLEPNREQEARLFDEMRGRIREDDVTVPVFDEGYWYYTRFETGKQQPIHARRRETMDAEEEVLLDGNVLASGHPFYKIGAFEVSRDGRLLAWADDTVGRNQFTLHVKEIATGKLFADTATNVAPMIAWAGDNRTVFYVGKDPTTLREDRVMRVALGGAHDLVYQEADTSYYVSVGTTKSRDFVVVGMRSTTNSEMRLVPASSPSTAPRVFFPRRKDHLYSIDHLDGRFLVRTNAQAKNFRICEVAEGKETDESAWKDLVAHRADTLVEGFALYHKFVAVSVRNGGLRKIEVTTFASVDAGGSTVADRYFLDASEPTYTMTVRDTPRDHKTAVRFVYESMVSPAAVYEVDVFTRHRTLLKEQPIPTYDSSRYASEYVHATAADGTRIPISIVYARTTPRDGTAPLYVYGYGSYGLTMDPRLDTNRVSLLDRGFVYAIAHIRGGQEMGRAWYEDGKLGKKMNTFTDFISATEFLVTQRYGARDRVYAQGGSAGGLLMGAVMNLRPDLYRAIVANVPFVDVVTTMLDESIPLTTNEFDEWGNPKEAEAYATMLAYSPYDNVGAKDYPSLYVHTGLWDSQVQYFEPAKWIARLRARKTDANLVLLDTDMTSGHGGASGRFDRLKQIAREVAFLLLVDARADARPARGFASPDLSVPLPD